jgi:ABC-type branched-subunit amino acid transport system ATPase component
MTAPVTAPPTAPALEIRGLARHFGAIAAARHIDLVLERGARHALIGPNGAGKTTLVNLITGVLKPSAGRVLLDGEDITGLPQAARARRGIARTFQINRLFRGLTVLENVCLAVAERTGAARRLFPSARRDAETIDEAMAHLDALRLAGDVLVPVRELPYGRQRLVEIALALAQRPRVLLLDEPAAGVPSAESHLILDAVAALDPGIAVLIIEHDMDVVFRFASRISVLVDGAVMTEGPPEAIVSDPRVRAVYLGETGGRHG